MKHMIIDWAARMTEKHGAIVHDIDGKSWDWKRALYREMYEHNWINSPEFWEVNDALPSGPVLANVLARMHKWEEGYWPEWVKNDPGIVMSQYLPYSQLFSSSDVLNWMTGEATLSEYMVDRAWSNLQVHMQCKARYQVLDTLAGECIETDIVPYLGGFMVVISEVVEQ